MFYTHPHSYFHVGGPPPPPAPTVIPAIFYQHRREDSGQPGETPWPQGNQIHEASYEAGCLSATSEVQENHVSSTLRALPTILSGDPNTRYRSSQPSQGFIYPDSLLTNAPAFTTGLQRGISSCYLASEQFGDPLWDWYSNPHAWTPQPVSPEISNSTLHRPVYPLPPDYSPLPPPAAPFDQDLYTANVDSTLSSPDSRGISLLALVKNQKEALVHPHTQMPSRFWDDSRRQSPAASSTFGHNTDSHSDHTLPYSSSQGGSSIGSPSVSESSASSETATSSPSPSPVDPEKAQFSPEPGRCTITGVETWLRTILQSHIPDKFPVSLDSLPYKPDEKPPLSYPWLISLAIFGSPGRRLKIDDIYTTIERRFPFFKHPTRNRKFRESTRHSMSLNRRFVRYFPYIDVYEPTGPDAHSAARGRYWYLIPTTKTRARKRRSSKAQANEQAKAKSKSRPSSKSRQPSASSKKKLKKDATRAVAKVRIMSPTTSASTAQSKPSTTHSPMVPPLQPYLIQEDTAIPNPHDQPGPAYAQWVAHQQPVYPTPGGMTHSVPPVAFPGPLHVPQQGDASGSYHDSSSSSGSASSSSLDSGHGSDSDMIPSETLIYRSAEYYVPQAERPTGFYGQRQY